jgi:hypothetical protein
MKKYQKGATVKRASAKKSSGSGSASLKKVNMSGRAAVAKPKAKPTSGGSNVRSAAENMKAKAEMAFVSYVASNPSASKAELMTKRADLGLQDVGGLETKKATTVGRTANDMAVIQRAPQQTMSKKETRVAERKTKKNSPAEAKKGGVTKMKAGGYVSGKTTPLYSNDPSTSQGRMVKKGGTIKKSVSAGMKKGGTVKRKKQG